MSENDPQQNLDQVEQMIKNLNSLLDIPKEQRNSDEQMSVNNYLTEMAELKAKKVQWINVISKKIENDRLVTGTGMPF